MYQNECEYLVYIDFHLDPGCCCYHHNRGSNIDKLNHIHIYSILDHHNHAAHSKHVLMHLKDQAVLQYFHIPIEFLPFPSLEKRNSGLGGISLEPDESA